MLYFAARHTPSGVGILLSAGYLEGALQSEIGFELITAFVLARCA